MFSRSRTALSVLSIVLSVHHVAAAPMPTWSSDSLLQAAQSVPDYFAAWLDIPSFDDIKHKLGVPERIPSETEVFNIPSYANWTEAGWNLRLHGTAYAPLPYGNNIVDKIGSVLMMQYPRNSWSTLATSNIRNMTRMLFAFPQKGLDLNFDVHTSDRSVTELRLPLQTDWRGEYETWTKLGPDGLGNDGGRGILRSLDIHTRSFPSGNATSFLVPQQGLTVISDVDDILRDARVWLPRQGLHNAFAFDYVPWAGMPGIMDSIYQSTPNIHFHYITTLPQPVGRKYINFVLNNYPRGSFDFRPMNLTSYEQIFFNRKKNTRRVFETFPERKFVLVGDNSNPDLIDSYTEMAKLFPNQVQCILLRNVTATDPGMYLPTSTIKFKGISPMQYQFFRTPADLAGIDFAHGGCRNFTFPQNVTFTRHEPIKSLAKTIVGVVKDAWFPTGLPVPLTG